MIEGGAWWNHVRLWKAKRDGDVDVIGEIKGELARRLEIQSAELARMAGRR